jgi:hypothetical protein
MGGFAEGSTWQSAVKLLDEFDRPQRVVVGTDAGSERHLLALLTGLTNTKARTHRLSAATNMAASTYKR